MSQPQPEGAIRVFFDMWSIYDLVLDHDYMAHRALYAETGRTLAAHFGSRPLSVLDLGCGSGRHLAPVLQSHPVTRYEGHDLSPVAIGHARRNFAALNCPLHFTEGDLRLTFPTAHETYNLIFSGFTLHHFTAAERGEILRLARQRLAPGGLLVLVDSMCDEDKTRAQWLDAYCGWIAAGWTRIPPEALQAIITHIRECDQPGTLPELTAVARDAGFRRSREIFRECWHVLWTAAD